MILLSISCKATANSLSCYCYLWRCPRLNVFGANWAVKLWPHGAVGKKTVTAYWWTRRELMQAQWFVCGCCQGLHHISSNDIKLNGTFFFFFCTLFLHLSHFHLYFPLCFYVIRALWTCTTTQHKIGLNMTWRTAVTLETSVPLLYLHFSTREQQFTKKVLTFQGWWVLKTFFFNILKQSEQSRIHCGCTKVPFPLEILSSCLNDQIPSNANSIIIKSFRHIPFSFCNKRWFMSEKLSITGCLMSFFVYCLVSKVFA